MNWFKQSALENEIKRYQELSKKIKEGTETEEEADKFDELEEIIEDKIFDFVKIEAESLINVISEELHKIIPARKSDVNVILDIVLDKIEEGESLEQAIESTDVIGQLKDQAKEILF